jgi:hypothetical protein
LFINLFTNGMFCSIIAVNYRDSCGCLFDV